MQTEIIASENHRFYFQVLALAIFDELFLKTVRDSFDEISRYEVKGEKCAGYINIDSADIDRNGLRERFIKLINMCLLGKVAVDISTEIGGELNTEVTIENNGFKFSFKITQYERNGEQGLELIEDPSGLPDDEKLGRVVELKITVA